MLYKAIYQKTNLHGVSSTQIGHSIVTRHGVFLCVG